MKSKNFLCISIGFVLFFSAAAIFTQERMLIDFGTLEADKQIGGIWQNEDTLYRNPETGKQESLHPAFWNTEKISQNWDPDKLPHDDFIISMDKVPDWARRFPGSPVMRVSGTLDSDYSDVQITPPFQIPGEERFEGYGLVRDLGPIRNVGLHIQNNGRPLSLSLNFEDETNTSFGVSFDIASVPDVWYEYNVYNSFADLESRFPEFHLDQVRLVSIWVGAADVREYWSDRYREMAPMTDEEKDTYERNNPVKHISSDIDFQLKHIVISGIVDSSGMEGGY